MHHHPGHNGYMDMSASAPMYGGAHMHSQQMGPPRRPQYPRGSMRRGGGYNHNSYGYTRGGPSPYQQPTPQVYPIAEDVAGRGSGNPGSTSPQQNGGQASPAGPSPQHQQSGYAPHLPPGAYHAYAGDPPPSHPYHYGHGGYIPPAYAGAPKKLQPGAQVMHPHQRQNGQHIPQQDAGEGEGGGGGEGPPRPQQSHNKSLTREEEAHQPAPPEGSDSGGLGVHHPVTQDMGQEVVDCDRDASCEGGTEAHRMVAPDGGEEVVRVAPREEGQMGPDRSAVNIKSNGGHVNGTAVVANGGSSSSRTGKTNKKGSKGRAGGGGAAAGIAGGGASFSSSSRGGPSPAQGRGGKEMVPSRIGQNNCYLNVVAQSLWSLRAFRDRICQSAHPAMDDGGDGPKLERTLRALMEGFGDRSRSNHSKGTSVLLIMS